MPKNLYTRNGIYWARFKVNGVEYRESLRTRSERVAERNLKALVDEIRAKAHFGIEGPKGWAEAVVAWSADPTAVRSASTRKRYLVSLRQLRPLLDGKTLADIDTRLVKTIVRARAGQGATNATIRRDLTAMSSVIEHAIDEEWMDTNPTLAIRRKRLKESRDPIVLPIAAEIKMMVAASPARFGDAIEFARETGMREEEIFGLRRASIKRDAITFVGKRNKMRTIPLTPKARQIVERQVPFITSDYVFWHGDGQRWSSPASRFGDIRRRVARKAAQAGQEFRGFRFHDLRHLYAVEFLRQRRGSLYDLQQLLGHDSIKTTEEYLRFLTPDEVKVAMHVVAQKAARGKRSGEAE